MEKQYTKIAFIGDVHGKYGPYKRLIKQYPNSIQVGDMGVGFVKYGLHGSVKFMINPPFDTMVETNARFIRGNHDNPSVCKKHKRYIADGNVEGNIMFIGGALSVDRAQRIEDLNWWRDEELSYLELDTLIEKYKEIKPEVMVTHDCPEDLATAMLQHFDQDKWKDFSRTRVAFQHMWSAHSPKVWVFGHWHRSFDQVIKGTRFVCLNELEVKEIDVDR